MVSIGAFENGPIAPLMRPMHPVCQLGKLLSLLRDVWLMSMRELLQLLVRREVGPLVRRLPKSGEGDSAVERASTFFSNDGIDGVGCVAVPWHFERVGERVGLGLEADFDDFHWAHDCDCLRRASAETSLCSKGNRSGRLHNCEYEDKRTEEHATRVRLPCRFVGECFLVVLEAGETDGHLGHDAGEDCAEALVERERRLALHDLCAGREE